jgi:hypothetical protein
MSKVDIMRKNTKAVYDQYEAVMAAFNAEEGEAQIYGGGREHMMDKGMLLDLDEEE